MALIPNPQSELIREPNLLRGKKPVGAVKIDNTHPHGDVLMVNLFRAQDGGKMLTHPDVSVPGLVYEGNYARRAVADTEYGPITFLHDEWTFMMILSGWAEEVASYVGEFNTYDPGFRNSTDGQFYWNGNPSQKVSIDLNRHVCVWTCRYVGSQSIVDYFMDFDTNLQIISAPNETVNGRDFKLLGGYAGATTTKFEAAFLWPVEKSVEEVHDLVSDPYQFLIPA